MRVVPAALAGLLVLAGSVAGSALTQACAQAPSPAVSGRETLTVSDSGSTRAYTRQELLSRGTLRTITIYNAVYHREMTFRAIPVADLLKGLKIDSDNDVQARAADNYSIGIPAELLLTADTRKQAFVAVEDPASPWPAVPGKPGKESPGPFYLVWRLAPSARVNVDFWIYRLTALTVTDGPLKRWPGLAVAADVPATDPVRVGLKRYVEHCIGCHRFNGEGEGEQGPDLGRPMNAVDYFQIPALRKLIRDPASVRKWPDQRMPGLDESSLSDADLDAVIAWLAYKARQPR